MANAACRRRPSASALSTPPNAASSSMPVSSDIPTFFSPRLITPVHKSPQSSSPSYFGLQNGDGATFLSDSSQIHAHKNWSPPSSAIRSTAAISPSVVPVDQHPDFELFRRQSQEKGFNLGGFGGSGRSHHATARSKPDRSISNTSVHEIGRVTPSELNTSRIRQASLSHVIGERSSPKRVLSPSADFSDRRASPASFTHDDVHSSLEQPRFKLPLDNINGAFGFSQIHRAETNPSAHEKSDADQQLLTTPQHVKTLLDTDAEDILLLDLRVSTQYIEAHISGALNLCIPTTLLKRPSFNVQKLTEIFKDDEQRTKFEKWRHSKYIIVYDANSSQLRDAQTCLNTIKKFRTEGYSGTCCIIKGGFREFSSRFPSHVLLEQSQSSPNGADLDADGPEVAPVAGGCPMPVTENAANPFFGNIRQNMDLIGGVGQIALKHPRDASSEDERAFPAWLSLAARKDNEGMVVSEKFERIERREKKRMEEALSGSVTWEESADMSRDKTQIAGIEKGSKNRYNNIWPFEHSRVKIMGVSKSECDYFNASHIQAAWSYKRYISTQAPIPATFVDFWNVVWQQDVRVIVMLTAEKEGPQVKAHNYWSDREYGALRLDFFSEKRASLDLDRIHKHRRLRPHHQKRSSTVASSASLSLALVDVKTDDAAADARNSTQPEQEQPYVIVRRFTLTNERKPFEPMREIVQLQYSSWPDFGAPAHPAHLLGLVEQTDTVSRAVNNRDIRRDGQQTAPTQPQLQEPEAEGVRPILVHCSAGCGRTGTFCTVDSVIDMLKRQDRAKHDECEHKMDVDTDTPSKHTKAPSAEKQLNASMPTERSKNAGIEKNLGGPEGAWVNRDDLDLIEKTVEDFRHQRISMVQSLRQYVLCYESIMEWFVRGRGEQK